LRRGIGSLVKSGVGVLYAPLAFAVVALWRSMPAASRGVLLLLGAFLSQCVYSAAVGGDVWEWYPVTNRFVTPALPALLVASAVGAWTVAIHGRPWLLWTLAAGFALIVSGRDALSRLVPSAQIAAEFGAVSIWLRGARIGGRVLAWLPTLLLGLAAFWPRDVNRRPFTAWVHWRLLACGLAVLVAANAGPAVMMRWRPGAAEWSTAATLTRLGVALRESTAPTASIAVVWAGIIPYFARRPAVDLLGRSDAIIARTPSHAGGFLPGHTKWDYEYSIGRLRPDLIVQLWGATPEDFARINSLGYEQILPDLFVLRDSTSVDRARLRNAVCRIWPHRCR